MPIFLMYWRRTMRKPGSILLWLVLPFAFMTIYQMAFGGNGAPMRTGLALVDRDSTFVSGLLKGAFEQDQLAQLLTIHPAGDMETVEQLFADGQASAALVIPDGFGDDLLQQAPIELALRTNPRHFIGPQIAEGVVGALVALGNGLVNTFGQPLRIVQTGMEQDAEVTEESVALLARMFYSMGEGAPNLGAVTAIDVVVMEEPADGEDATPAGFNMATFFFPGLLMFGLLSVSLSLEWRFLRDRQEHVTNRLVTAPVSRWSVVLQQRFYALTFLYVIAIACALIAGMVWRIAPVGVVTVNFISIGLILAITGINGTIFGLSNSIKAVSAISSIVMIFLTVVGGGFFPTEATPEWFQGFSRYTPTGMANLGITYALTGRDAVISYPVLGAYCGGLFLLSLLVGRRRI